MPILNGYLYVKVNNILYPYHRLVVERFIGRILTKQERVHHINWNKQDNRIENLYLFPNQKEHKKFENRVKQFRFTSIILREIQNRWKLIPIPLPFLFYYKKDDFSLFKARITK